MLRRARIHRQLFESARDGLWVVDARGRSVMGYDRAAAVLGRSERELRTLDPESVLDQVVALQVERRILTDSTGEPAGVLYRLTDDRGRLDLIDQLRRSESTLADAQAIAGVGSWEVDVRRDEATWSQQLYVLLGLDPATFVPSVDGYFAMMLPGDRERVLADFEALQREPGERSADGRIRRSDGAVRWVRAVGQVLEWAEDGTPLRIGGTVQDIDDLKQTELQLRDAVELNTLMQVMATAANETNTLDEALTRLRDLLLAHHDWQRAVAFTCAPAGLAPLDVGGTPAAATALERRVAERALAARGTVFEEQARPQAPMIGFPVLVDRAPVVVNVITARSPFERHEMLRSLALQVAGQLAQVAAREAVSVELAAARDAAMEASRAKSDFLATMSHEIRTPLNGVIGLNDLLLRSDLDDRQLQLAQGIEGAGRALLVLINDILDFSKIEAGELELESVEFRVRPAMQRVLDLFAPAAAEKAISMVLDVADDVPDRLVGDPGRFAQVLSNLVSNAVKFTDAGQVEVRAMVHREDSGVPSGPALRVVVTDTGIGMHADQLERVFQPFRQADASTTRTFGGTGLGLAISRRLAAALEGDLGVSSTPGEGSSFWFTARFGSARSRGPGDRGRHPDAPTAGRTGHVLVVEDNDVNQLVAVGMLEALGFTAEVAADGESGAREALSGRYDAVLMDLQMPRVDGFTSARRIRASEPAGVRVPIIAVTASATEGERKRCLAVGMDGFLSKPISLERLDALLHDHLAVPPADRAPASRPSRPVPTAGAGTPALDTSRLDELAEMGEEALPLIQRAVDNFIAGAAEQVAALRMAVVAGDAAGLRSAAHRLKGSALNLGALQVADHALALEETCTSGRLDDAGPLLDRLESALDEAIEALRGLRLSRIG
jgi:signal transduction histidine kinase/DNA-binding NarL/FixJ family response regulator/HPt (histidine-containing phosphotransfer) domain-containing protein